MRLWALLRDIVLTGTGLWIIVVQSVARKPSDVLLVVGLALTTPAAAVHAAQILGAGTPIQGHSSPSSPSDGSQPSPSSPEAGAPRQASPPPPQPPSGTQAEEED